MIKPNTIYISGAISGNTGETQEYKMRKFAAAEAYWAHKGYWVVNPLAVRPCVDNSCGGERTGLSQDSGVGFEHSWSCYMRHDLIEMLTRCTHIAMLPHWERSKGARIERDMAMALGFDLIHMSIEQLNSGFASLRSRQESLEQVENMRSERG